MIDLSKEQLEELSKLSPDQLTEWMEQNQISDPEHKNEFVKQLSEIFKNKFPALDDAEIKRRESTDLGAEETFNIVFNAIRNSSSGYATIDLRHYRTVPIGNIIFASVPYKYLDSALYYSKFDQQVFPYIGLSEEHLSLRVGTEAAKVIHTPAGEYGDGSYLGRMLLFNCNGAGTIEGNIKFSASYPLFVFLAEDVQKMQMDVREMASVGQVMAYMMATNYDQSLNGPWQMYLFSMANASLIAENQSRYSKWTNGKVLSCNNDGTKFSQLDISGLVENDSVLYYDPKQIHLDGSIPAIEKPTLQDLKEAKEDLIAIEKAFGQIQNIKLSEKSEINPATKDPSTFTSLQFNNICKTLFDLFAVCNEEKYAIRLQKIIEEKATSHVNYVGDQMIQTMMVGNIPLEEFGKRIIEPSKAPQKPVSMALKPENKLGLLEF